jgi:succinate dehydrogenase/fumarate reductase flavoprotein subunit
VQAVFEEGSHGRVLSQRMQRHGGPSGRLSINEVSTTVHEVVPSSTDVVVVGAGNAALCAALAAAEQGVSVLILERAPENEAGGNSRFTAGAFRCVYNDVDDLRTLMPDLTNDEVTKSDFGSYTEEQFFDDMSRVTEIPHRSRFVRDFSKAQQGNDAVDAR